MSLPSSGGPTRPSSSSGLSAAEILSCMEVLRPPGVYYVGHRTRRLTFLSQQVRSLNLVWALSHEGRLKESTRVAVVGGGLAGLTVATAATRLGAEVTLLERKPDVLHLQRGSHLRYVHPNIYDWPREGSDYPLTDLPCLNWGAGTAAQVADVILRQWGEWEGTPNRVRCLFSHDVEHVEVASGQLRVRSRQFDEAFEVVILTVGFGLEGRHPPVPFLSYWENDNFDRAVLADPIPRRVLVSGCGDGGLIDALRLCSKDFDHVRFTYEILANAEFNTIKPQLLEIDRVASGMPPEQQAEFLHNEYRQIAERLSKRFWTNLEGGLRRDRLVTLNDRKLSALSLNTAILNRFVIFLLLHHNQLKGSAYLVFRPGKTEIVKVDDEYHVTFESATSKSRDEMFHEVVVRRGADSAVKRLFPDLTDDELRPDPAGGDDPTRWPQYPPGFLIDRQEWLTVREKARFYHAIRSSSFAFDRIASAGTPAAGPVPSEIFQQLGIVLLPNPMSFGVQLSCASLPGLPIEEIGQFVGVPVNVTPAPTAQAFPTAGQSTAENIRRKARPLTAGVKIWNANLGTLTAPPVGGTIGCFVQILGPDGGPGFLTVADALGDRGRARQGDRIAQSSGPPFDDGDIVAELVREVRALPIPGGTGRATRGIRENRFDGAVARLITDVECMVVRSGLPALQQPRPARVGEGVYVAGAACGLVHTTVQSVSQTTSVPLASAGLCRFVDLIALKCEVEAVDAGAPVIADDGTLLGIILGQFDKVSYAYPIQAALEALEVMLIL